MYRARLWEIGGDLKNGVKSATWVVHHYRGLRHSIETLGHHVQSLTPIKITSWHRGARYFRVSLEDGKRVFLKTEGNYRLLAQEIEAASRVSLTSNSAHLFQRVQFHRLDGDYPLAAFEWLDALPLELILRRRGLRGRGHWIGSQFLALLEALSRANIIHRDITPKNLLVSVGSDTVLPQLFLVDFAFAVVDGKSLAEDRVPLSDLRQLCEGYKPSPLVWDDAFSCLAILRLVERSGGERLDDLSKRIAGHVGRLTFSAAMRSDRLSQRYMRGPVRTEDVARDKTP